MVRAVCWRKAFRKVPGRNKCPRFMGDFKRLPFFACATHFSISTERRTTAASHTLGASGPSHSFSQAEGISSFIKAAPSRAMAGVRRPLPYNTFLRAWRCQQTNQKQGRSASVLLEEAIQRDGAAPYREVRVHALHNAEAKGSLHFNERNNGIRCFLSRKGAGHLL